MTHFCLCSGLECKKYLSSAKLFWTQARPTECGGQTVKVLPSGILGRDQR